MFIKFIESRFGKIIDQYSYKHVSRFLILVIDLLIAGTSYVLATVLRFNFNLADIPIRSYQYHLLVIILIRFFYFLYQRTYYGIVRRTSLQDVIHLFAAVSYSSLTILLLSLLVSEIPNLTSLYIPVSIIVIDYFICLFLLVMSRMFVKSIYSDITKSRRGLNGQPVLIYGTGNLGIHAKNALLNDEKQYEVIGFIDDNPTLIGKTLQGISIYSFTEAINSFVIDKQKNPLVILAIKNINPITRNRIAEKLLVHSIILKIIPSRLNPINDKINSRAITDIKIEDLLQRAPIKIDNKNVSHEVIGKIILVTGAAGSIGTELVRQILQYNPSKIYLIDNSEAAMYNFEFELKQKSYNTEIHYLVTDINNHARIEKLLTDIQPNIVYHCAAYKHVPLMEKLPYEAVRTNIFGTKNLADVCNKLEVNKFVLISTDKAVNPTNVMGATKRITELYIQSLSITNKSRTKFVITRFGNVLGSNGSVVPLFEKQILKGGPITVTHLDIERFFMTIPEASQLVLEASAMGQGGETYVFDMGKAVKIHDLAKKMIQLSGLILDQDIKIEITNLRPGEKLFEELQGSFEKNIKTHHPKILISKPIQCETSNIASLLIELGEVLNKNNDVQIVQLLKRHMPEYKSKNSEYEKLDLP